ncbi:hypothetical protein EVAR_55667_1 [Eumeta japonica]|uniref:Uncharacterized protein n=1 Tax=Eumeta variegata TaxID=151549 RepID=A0A4C1ZV12_EUMVA|nr:hypothetical protein EVAR_55667_1 [Eumeta japonica]
MKSPFDINILVVRSSDVLFVVPASIRLFFSIITIADVLTHDESRGTKPEFTLAPNYVIEKILIRELFYERTYSFEADASSIHTTGTEPYSPVVRRVVGPGKVPRDVKETTGKDNNNFHTGGPIFFILHRSDSFTHSIDLSNGSFYASDSATPDRSSAGGANLGIMSTRNSSPWFVGASIAFNLTAEWFITTSRQVPILISSAHVIAADWCGRGARLRRGGRSSIFINGSLFVNNKVAQDPGARVRPPRRFNAPFPNICCGSDLQLFTGVVIDTVNTATTDSSWLDAFCSSRHGASGF